MPVVSLGINISKLYRAIPVTLAISFLSRKLRPLVNADRHNTTTKNHHECKVRSWQTFSLEKRYSNKERKKLTLQQIEDIMVVWHP